MSSAVDTYSFAGRKQLALLPYLLFLASEAQKMESKLPRAGPLRHPSTGAPIILDPKIGEGPIPQRRRKSRRGGDGGEGVHAT